MTYLFRELTNYLRINHQSTTYFRDFTKNVNRIKIHYLFRESLSPSHNQFKIFFLNSLFIHILLQDFSQIHYLLREVNMNLLSISQIHYEFTLFRAFIMNRLSFSRFHLLFFESTMN